MASTKTNNAAEVVSRILTEDVLTLTQARDELASITGIRPDKATLTRWIHRGVGGIKLEAIRLGGRNIFTSTQALTRFIEARTRTLSR
ncbi:MAG TPA: DUF1580 domain-containing protein [Pirellula sp.]|nr:DUF1580 domain-containing protein [Pirellula sp.]